MKPWLAALPAAVLFAAPAYAAPRVEVVAEPPSLLVGQTGALHVMVVSEGGGQIQVAGGATPELEVPDGIDLRYSGMGQSFAADGTRIVSVVTYQYLLNAMSEGTWTVGPVGLRLADGSRITADPIQVKVQARSTEGVPQDDLALTAGFNVAEAWEGQLVLYQYELTSSIQGVRAGWRLPEFEGLRQPRHGAPAEQSYKVYDGDATITTVRGTVPLIATGLGTLNVSPAIASVDIPTGRQGFRGWGGLRQERRATESVQLLVRPLPTPPADFSGLVGDVKLQASLDGTSAAVGESVGLTITIDSNGSLDGVLLPPYEADGFSVYEDAQRIGGKVTDTGYRGVASIRRVLVPVEPGTLTLPAVTLTTFSPKQGRYVTHEVALDPLEVTPGREGSGEIKSYAQDAELPEAEPVEVRAPWTWGTASTPRLGLGVPLLLFGAAAPGGAVLFGHGLAAMRRRWRAWTTRDKGPPTPFSHLRGLPEEPQERLRAYDTAIRQALANRQGVAIGQVDRERVLATLPPEVAKDLRSLQRGLDSVRYGDVPIPEQLDGVVRRVLAAVEAA